MKRQTLILTKLLLVSIISFFPLIIVNATNVDDVVIDNYVVDNANILSTETENYIIENSKKLENADGTQFVVVTVDSLEGMSIEQYALTLARKTGLGDAQKDNGLLILISKNDRELRIEVGRGLEGVLPDGKCGRFRDKYMTPYLKNDDWDDGIKNGYDAFFSEIVTENNLSLDYNSPSGSSNTGFDIDLFSLMISFIIGVFYGILIKSKKTTKKNFIAFILITIGVGILAYLIFSAFSLLGYIFANIIGLVIGLAPESSSSGGGFFDGGFSSRGGGGFSSGGGGFSGGGGGFSGGGASGKF